MNVSRFSTLGAPRGSQRDPLKPSGASSGDLEKHAFCMRHPSILSLGGPHGASEIVPKSDLENFDFEFDFLVPPRDTLGTSRGQIVKKLV